jgi:phosphate transport system substrate-binding protein
MLRQITLGLVIFVASQFVPAQFLSADVEVQGGGATFPNPIYQQWARDFGQTHPNLRIAYAAKGSGAGIKGVLDRTFDFCGSDAPLSDDELKMARSRGGDVIQIPSLAGAIVVAYNLPGFIGDLKLSGQTVAEIYLGRITRWNDPAIASLNPGIALPDLDITTVHRSDGSGTTFVFTSYLCTQSDDFQTRINFGKMVYWPNGQSGSGNAGVTQAVQGSQGAIGYIELNYALANHIPFALLRNKSDNFIKASPQTVSAAGEASIADMDLYKTLAVRLWDRDGNNVYPISSFTYLVCYKDLGYLVDRAKARAIVDFFWYATHDGQTSASAMSYAPLSPGVRRRVEQAIESITFNGEPLNPAHK